MTPAARLSPEQRERIVDMLIYADSYVEGFAAEAWIWSNMGARAGLISKAWGYALDADALRALLAAQETPPGLEALVREWQAACSDCETVTDGDYAADIAACQRQDNAAAALCAWTPPAAPTNLSPVDAKEWTCPTCGNDSLWCKCPAAPVVAEPDTDTTVYTITVFREDDGRFAAEWLTGDQREGGMGEYSASPIGAIAELTATLIKVEEDRRTHPDTPPVVAPAPVAQAKAWARQGRRAEKQERSVTCDRRKQGA